MAPMAAALAIAPVSSWFRIETAAGIVSDE
jgi:hypothetical protein